MAKNELVGWLQAPLAGILSTRGKTAVLRVLLRSNGPIPFREAARRTHLAYRSVELALNDLIDLGIVAERVAGRERHVSLNSNHRLTGPLVRLFEAEADYYPALRSELAAAMRAGPGFVSLSLVGAAARRLETIAAPIEAVLIIAEARDLPAWHARMDALAEQLRERFGIRLRLIVYELSRARALWATRTAAAAELVRDAELVAGRALREVLEAIETSN